MSQVEVTEVKYEEHNLIEQFTKFLKNLNKELKTSYAGMYSLKLEEDFDEIKRPLKNGDVLFFENEESYGGPNDLFFAVEWSQDNVKHISLVKFASDNDTMPPMFNFCDKKMEEFLYDACERSKIVNPNQICCFQNQEHYKVKDLKQLSPSSLKNLYVDEKILDKVVKINDERANEAYFYSEGSELARVVSDSGKLYIEHMSVKNDKLIINRDPDTITFVDFC